MTRVLLLEAAGPESGAIAATATARGYQIYAVTDPDQHTTYSPDLHTALSGCLLADFTRPAHAAGEIIDFAFSNCIDAVLTTNEYLTPLLAEVCTALGLPGNDPALAGAARNKADMSRRFARCGVTAPSTHIVATENALLRLPATRELTYPFVIKPADGAGSAGVTVVHSAPAAVAAMRAAREPRGMYGMPLDPRILVQEFAEGTEYSVESITQNGVSSHLCLTRKTTTDGAHRVELGHGLPAILPPETETAVFTQVDRAIAAVGIRNGASHTEVMLAPDGQCTVIEIGARLGAGQIGFLLAHALGVDPWAACLDVALGRTVHLALTRNGYAAVRFLTSPHPGRLASVTGLPLTSHRVPTVHMRKAIGDRVDDAPHNGARLGYFVVTGPDADTVDAHADDLFRQIRVEVAPHNPLGSDQLRSANTAAMSE